MLKGYLKLAFRNFKKNRLHTSLSVIGLAIGIATSFLSFIYIYHELTYENQHKEKERIYRVACGTTRDGTITNYAPAPAVLGPTLFDKFPEVESFARLRFPFEGIRAQVDLVYNEKVISVEKSFEADSSFFEIFTYDFTYGDRNALKNPDQVVISAELSRALFGSTNPIGEYISVNDHELEVSGVVDIRKSRTHLDFNMLISWTTFDYQGYWDSADSYTYLLLSEGHNIEEFEVKLDQFTESFLESLSEDLDASIALIIQPLESVHLHSHFYGEISQNGEIVYISIFILISIFIIIIASVNYVNIAISTSARRAKEIGLRKSFGALNNQVRNQFLIEAILMSLCASAVGIIFILFLLPFFQEILGIRLGLGLLLEPMVGLFFIVLVILLGVLSGMYPAFYLAKLMPVDIFKGSYFLGENITFRKGLAILQFLIAIVMIVSTLIVVNQLNFIENRSLGFEKDNIVVIPVPENTNSGVESLREHLLTYPSIKKVSVSNFVPSAPETNEYFFMIDGQRHMRTTRYLSFDNQFLDILKLEVVDGKAFDPVNSTNTGRDFLVNEAFVRKFGWNEPVGQIIGMGRVIGVVRDANMFSLHEEIEPLVVRFSKAADLTNKHLFVKIDEVNNERALAAIQTAYEERFVSSSFHYDFLDDIYDNLYSKDKSLKNSLILSCSIVILISCLGLFALSGLIAIQKLKEVAIRKVLGASPFQVYYVQIKGLLVVLIWANLIAIPLIYYSSSRWLQQFAYRTNLGFEEFILGIIASLLIVGVSMSFHIVKLARLSPIEAIKVE